MIKSKKGSVMVEAAVTFPIVTLAVLFVIYMLINMYSQVVINSKLHIAAADEAMSISQVSMQREIEKTEDFGSLYHIWFPDKEIEIEKINTLLCDTVCGTVNDEIKSKGLLNSIIQKEYRIEIEIIDEEEYIRCVDAVTGIIKEAV